MDNNNLFSIGEIAKAIGITRKIILNYETKGLITPDKKDGTTGNRYYTIDTFTQIRTIRVFQDLGLSLDEIREYFDGKSDLQPMINRLEKMRDELNLTIEKLKERTREKGGDIQEITIEPQHVYCRTYNATSIADKTNLLRDTALEAMKKYETDTRKRLYFTEYSANAPMDINYCVAIPDGCEGEYVKIIPELKAISFFHHGAYEEISKARKRPLSLLYFIEQATTDAVIKSGKNDARDCEAIKEHVQNSCSKIKELRVGLKNLDADEKYQRQEEIEEVYSKTIKYVSKKLKNLYMLKYLLLEIENSFQNTEKEAAEEGEEEEEDKKFYWTLFEMLCLEENRFFTRVLAATRNENMYDLVLDPSGDITIYDVQHTQKMSKFAKK